MALAYVFWLSVSNLTGTETIGNLAAATAFGTILTSVATIGIPTGIQRFLGKAVADDDKQSFSKFTRTSLVLLSISVLTLVVFLVILNNELRAVLNFHPEFFFVSVIMVAGASLYQLFRGVMISSARTRLLLIVDVTGEIGRIMASVILITLINAALGLVGGFVALYFVTLSILIPYTAKIIRNHTSVSLNFKRTSKEILQSGTVSWVPNVITQIGTQMGFLVTFGILGAFDTGVYFIAFAVFSVVLAIPSSILTVAYPLMSGMNDSRRHFLSLCIKIALLSSVPTAVAITTVSSPLLSLFGTGFQTGSTMLMVLLISIAPTTISNAIFYLAYAYGKYRYVLIIGLLGSISKIALYPMLVPDFGGFGASLAFLAGSIAAFLGSVVLAYRMDFRLLWKQILVIVLIPASIGSIAMIANFPPIAGVSAILIISVVMYMKLNIIRVNELREILSNTLPKTLADPICNNIDRFRRFLGE
jgi:O-antigen/teichoic acid export membrane protein